MHPPLIIPDFLVAIFFLLFFVAQPITSQEIADYEACKRPSRCHDMDIRYPFLVGGRPSYCGYQSLLLDCEGSKSDIWRGSAWYRVKNISYADRLVTLVDKDVLHLDGCPTSSSYESITTDYTPEFTPGWPSILLLTGCPQRPKGTRYSNFRDMGFYEICPGDGSVANYTSVDWVWELGCSNLVKVGLTAAALSRLDGDNSLTIRDVMKGGVEFVRREGEGWCPGC